MNESDHYDWVAEAPFLTITLNRAGYDLPGEVIAEVLKQVSLMVQPEAWVEPQSANAQAAGFECSRIEVGFTPEEAEGYAWEGNEGTLVAIWSSGVSTGFSTSCYLTPDGSYTWTEG